MKPRAVLLLLALLVAPAPAGAHDNHVVKLLAGSPGYDHIQPFMAEKLGFWDKYGVKVEFVGGNYIRANNMMSTGDFDVGYIEYELTPDVDNMWHDAWQNFKAGAS